MQVGYIHVILPDYISWVRERVSGYGWSSHIRRACYLEEMAELNVCLAQDDSLHKGISRRELCGKATGDKRAALERVRGDMLEELGDVIFCIAALDQSDRDDLITSQDRELVDKACMALGTIMATDLIHVTAENRNKLLKRDVEQAMDLRRKVGESYSCNMHMDCASADLDAKAIGKKANHCHNSDCEDCFPK